MTTQQNNLIFTLFVYVKRHLNVSSMVTSCENSRLTCFVPSGTVSALNVGSGYLIVWRNCTKVKAHKRWQPIVQHESSIVILNLIRRRQKPIRSLQYRVLHSAPSLGFTVSDLGTVRVLTHMFGHDCFMLHTFYLILRYHSLFDSM
jgi:hypothetical protein